MCGIHAVITTDKTGDYKAPKFIEQGFVANQLRGLDSSGMFQIADGDVGTHKMALNGSLFIDNKVTKEFIRAAAKASITVCHVRHATSGKITADNAHPFIAYKKNGKQVIGVHNGTLTNWRSFPGTALFDVDSEWAINHIAEEGADAFEDFQGAFCFFWWDEEKPDILHIARNDERPMHFAVSDDRKSIYFGSEAGMVNWLTERNEIKVLNATTYILESKKLYQFDLSGKQVTWETGNLPSYRYKPSSNNSYSNNNNYSGNRGGYNYSAVPDGYPDYGKRKVEEFNRIVNEAAAAKTGEGTGVSLPVAISEVIHKSKKDRRREAAQARAQADKAKLAMNEKGEWVLPDNWFRNSTATQAEKNYAKAQGSYGTTVVGFTPVYYEPDTMEIFGSIEDFDVATRSKISWDAVIRGIKSTEAAAMLANEENTWYAVIGVTDVQQDRRRYVVLGELTEEGSRKVKLSSSV